MSKIAVIALGCLLLPLMASGDELQNLLADRCETLSSDPETVVLQDSATDTLPVYVSEPKRTRTAVEAPLTPYEAPEDIREQTREALLDDVRLGWERPRRMMDPVVQEQAVQAADMRQRLQAVTIPQVQFAEVPLSEVLDLLGAVSQQYDPAGMGFNLVLIDPSQNNPMVSISLRNLSFDRTLELILTSVGYEYDLDCDAVIIRKAMVENTCLETSFFPLSRSTIIRLTGMNSGAEENPYRQSGSVKQEEAAIRAFLQRAGVSFDTVPGASLALADGQLIVTQSPRNLQKVSDLLRRYREVKQVEIEARFLEVTQGDLEEIGFNWQITNGDGDQGSSQNRTLNSAFNTSSANSTLTITGLSPLVVGGGTLSLPMSAPVLTNTLDLGSGSGTLADLSGVWGAFDVELLINALSRSTGSDLMSAPKVTVLSGKTAEIVVAQELRYPQRFGHVDAQVGKGDSGSGSAGVAVTAGTPQDFTMRNIGVEMQVTPTVEDDDSISLLLEPTVTEFEGFVEYGGPSVAIASGQTVTVPSGFYQPVFSVRKIRTEVTIWDGSTVIMGGLTREQAVQIQDKVPILGDLPLIGQLFRSEGESSQKKNLLIFVTANMISPGGAPARKNRDQWGPLYEAPAQVTPAGTEASIAPAE